MTDGIQYIDVTIAPGDDDMLAKKHLISRLRPDWNPDDIVTKIITGGFINVTARFHNKDDEEKKDAMIMRCYREWVIPPWISHDHELATMQLAYQAGCFGRVYAAFNNGIVYEFLPGRNLTEAEITDPTIIRLIARCLAQFHSTEVDKIPTVDKFEKHAPIPRGKFHEAFCKQLDTFLELDFAPRWKARVQGLHPRIEEWKREMTDMASVYEELGLTQAFCHHDVHARNIVYDEQTGHLSLVDFEAAKFGFVAFDFSYMFNFYILADVIGLLGEEFHDFPLGKGPVSRETRLIYARSYLERKYELEGRDASCVDQEALEVLLVEMQLLDIIMPLIQIMLCMGQPDELEYMFHIIEPFTQIYYERKANLEHLQQEYRRLKSGV